MKFRPARRQPDRRISLRLESLESRRLLSTMPGPFEPPLPPPVPAPHLPPHHLPTPVHPIGVAWQ